MSEVGQKERRTQQRVVKLLRDTLKYRYLGFWDEREANSNVEENLVRAWLRQRGCDDALITKVMREVEQARAVHGARSLYDANRDFYALLRYGAKVRPQPGEPTKTVWLVDWEDPSKNELAFAEEVTIAGEHDKRPDIVVYVNGIAVAVLELKRSVISVTEGIRQNIGNQRKDFIAPFFATIQLVMAGNDTEGLRYGVIGSGAKDYLTWREPSEVENRLDRALLQLGRKDRLLELIHDFIVFDAGVKKIARHNQYFGIKLAQNRVRQRIGGILWHTQGSGKSLTMVWLAKWIRENVAGSRVLIITDREDLDRQIDQRVFGPVGETIYRTKSGADLLAALEKREHWLICSLIQKFRGRDEDAGDVDGFVAEIKAAAGRDFSANGEFFVFVDECHRTQSGLLHDAMREILPGAMFIGFTGTPLLRKDKKTTIEKFGPYIHTYRYDEAVRDKVVVDLVYEARDIDQRLGAPEKVDHWFEMQTKGMTEVARAQLKQRWGTMQELLSSDDRLSKIVADVVWDMQTRPRLMEGRGNALLVAGSIHQACRLYEKIQQTPLAGKSAIVTSYRPLPGNIAVEDVGDGENEALEKYAIYRRMLADHFGEPEAAGKVEEFERQVKERFIKEPGQMKLLIVVDRLLTGFDAPPATYLYIDKPMKDHGLFQAVCRVNRLDGEDKEYGYIVDYRNLFGALERSVKEYTGDAFSGYDRDDIVGLLTERLERARQDLVEGLEAVRALCDPVSPPRESESFLRYFCGTDRANPDRIKETEQRRVALYRLVARLVRTYSAIAHEMEAAKFSPQEAANIKEEVAFYENVRGEVKLASGDYIDLKVYEPAMRHLLDTYVRAEDSVKLSQFDDKTILELILERGADAIDALPEGIRRSQEATAEVIANNLRRVIIDEMAVNPKYYERMSRLLDGLIRARKEAAIEFKAWLDRMAELAKQVQHPEAHATYPLSLSTPALRNLYDTLDWIEDPVGREDFAIRVDTAIRDVKKDGWRGDRMKEKEVLLAIADVVESDREHQLAELSVLRADLVDLPVIRHEVREGQEAAGEFPLPTDEKRNWSFQRTQLLFDLAKAQRDY